MKQFEISEAEALKRHHYCPSYGPCKFDQTKKHINSVLVTQTESGDSP